MNDLPARPDYALLAILAVACLLGITLMYGGRIVAAIDDLRQEAAAIRAVVEKLIAALQAAIAALGNNPSAADVEQVVADLKATEAEASAALPAPTPPPPTP